MGAGSAELEARRAPPRVHGIPGRRERVQGPSDGPRVAGASSPNGGAQVNRTGSGALPDAGLSRTLSMADHGVVPRGSATDRAAALLALHTGSGFVLPNAWDAGSARVLEQVGFPAIATTSAGISWACGVPDGAGFGRDRMLEHIGAIVAAVDVPVSADLEDGYGDTPAEVGRTVARAVQVGAVGANVEDAGNGRLYGVDEAVDRVAAARAAAPSGTFVLNARTDTYFVGVEGDAFAETVERAHRYLDAGADCIFVPGVAEADTIRRLAEAVPGPLNVVAGLANSIDAPTLFALGVKRVSLGGSLARASLSLLERAGRELLDTGTLGFLEGAIGYADLQRRFSP